MIETITFWIMAAGYGQLSILIASAMVPFQMDWKRELGSLARKPGDPIAEVRDAVCDCGGIVFSVLMDDEYQEAAWFCQSPAYSRFRYSWPWPASWRFRQPPHCWRRRRSRRPTNS